MRIKPPWVKQSLITAKSKLRKERVPFNVSKHLLVFPLLSVFCVHLQLQANEVLALCFCYGPVSTFLALASHLQDVRRESIWAAHLQCRARNKQKRERLHWKQMPSIHWGCLQWGGFPTMPKKALVLCLYYSHFLLHDCSQLFMMGICAYFKCASAHLNTPMCYVVLCIQCFIKIAPTKD